MKKSFFKFILLASIFFCGTAVLNSCSKSDAFNDISPQNSSLLARNGSTDGKMKPTIFNCKMKVTYANSEGKDITSLYDGYTFLFEDNGYGSGFVYVYDDQGGTERGKWYTNPSGSSNSMSLCLKIHYTLYTFLTRDWSIFDGINEIIFRYGNVNGTVYEDGISEIRFAERL